MIDKKKSLALEVTIQSYREFFRYHMNLQTGEETVWIDGKKMTAQEFNAMQDAELEAEDQEQP